MKILTLKKFLLLYVLVSRSKYYAGLYGNSIYLNKSPQTKNVKSICTEGGKFLAPLPMSVKTKEELINKLVND
ncbi:hypothetical protein MHK_003017, partial [Candidatus Magnetomorum sp. HK-1]